MSGELWAVNCDRAGCDMSWLGDAGQPRAEAWGVAVDAGWGGGLDGPHYCPEHAPLPAQSFPDGHPELAVPDELGDPAPAVPRPLPETIVESSNT